tara:strand:- start:71906 stop:72220 length:315 start_codon:yes stop_codon:yes gene_type:complete
MQTKLIIVIIILPLIIGCSSCNEEKLPEINSEHESLEFCIPLDKISNILSIASDAEIIEEATGQIDCDPETEVLVLLELHTEKDVLCDLAKLEYVSHILASSGE